MSSSLRPTAASARRTAGFTTYDESEMIGIDNVKTSLYIKPDNSVILQRSAQLTAALWLKAVSAACVITIRPRAKCLWYIR
ncbi:MAG: hypothetical protein ACLR56_01750 [Oscillospiraceae bacterium]